MLFVMIIISVWAVLGASPLEPLSAGRLTDWGQIFYLWVLFGFGLVMMLFWRSARLFSTPIRRKTKYFIMGMGILLGFKMIEVGQAVINSRVQVNMSGASIVFTVLGCGLILFALVRHRLLNVDLFISRYVIHKTLPPSTLRFSAIASPTRNR